MYFPSDGIALNQSYGCGQVHLVARKAAVIVFGLPASDRRSGQLAKRIETLEFQATVVAEQFVQACQLKDNGRIIVATLNACALAAGTPHLLMCFRVADG